MSVDECLLDVVGVVRTQPKCVDAPEGVTESKSGLFLSELKGIDILSLQHATECAGLFDIIHIAKLNAIQALKTDLSVEMSKVMKSRRQNWSGKIGRTNYAGITHLQGDFKGFKVYSNIRGGVMIVNGLTLMLDATGNTQLTVYKDGEEIGSYQLFSEANKATAYILETPLTLELDGSEYMFIYESDANPLSTKFGCCGFNQRYSLEHPLLGNNERDGWSKWVVTTGVYGDNIGDLKEHNTPCGLSLDVSFSCNSLGILCNENMDFTTDPVALAIAHALRYKWGEFTLDGIVDRNLVNRYTLLTNDTMAANKEYYLERYNGMLEYIVGSINYYGNDCWVCQEKMTIKGQML